jgi:hypothetical protein
MMVSVRPDRQACMDKLIDYPWQHLVVDNFLTTKVLAKSLSEISAEAYDYEIEYRGTGRIEFSLVKSETLWRAIYSKKTIALLSFAFGVNVKLNKHNMVQLRRMNDDTPEFPLHNDFSSNDDSIASFLYLNSGWSSKCGGRLHLFESEKNCAPAASIEPSTEQVCRLPHQTLPLAFRGKSLWLGKAKRTLALGR